MEPSSLVLVILTQPPRSTLYSAQVCTKADFESPLALQLPVRVTKQQWGLGGLMGRLVTYSSSILPVVPWWLATSLNQRPAFSQKTLLHTQLFLFWLLVTISWPLASPGLPRYPLLISQHSARTFVYSVLMKSSQFKCTIYLLPKLAQMPPKFKFFFISDHLDHLSMPHILFAHIIEI